MNRIAVLDLGTNTFNAVVAEKNEQGFNLLFNHKIGVKLGEGGINNKVIQDIPFWRGIDAIERLLNQIKTYQPILIYATATSAIRSASNGHVFVDTIKKLFNLDVHVITGNMEAGYIYGGVSVALSLHKKPSLIMDIGGGSTEFIIANQESILWKKSYPLGVARLLDKFNPAEPIQGEMVLQIQQYIWDKLHDLPRVYKIFKPVELIGSSGSFDTLADLQCHRLYDGNFLNNKTNYTFNLVDLRIIHQLLLNSDKTQRMNMRGMEPMRVDMMVLADIFIWLVLDKLDITAMRLSTYSLKEGVLKMLFDKKN